MATVAKIPNSHPGPKLEIEEIADRLSKFGKKDLIMSNNLIIVYIIPCLPYILTSGSSVTPNLVFTDFWILLANRRMSFALAFL